MPCYKPRAVSQKGIKPNGKQSISFDITKGGKIIFIPCGQCIGCRLERSRQWAIRCVNEAKQYDKNIFITLTYKDMPKDNSLNKRDFQLFMKKLRKANGPKIRFFHCGEYGEQCSVCGNNKDNCKKLNTHKFVSTLGRPHHHACIFNFDFSDKVFYDVSKKGEPLYTSLKLTEMWGHGYALIGAVTWESAAYVARYVTKKITGNAADAHYGNKLPEHVTMSNRPGIGKNFYEKYYSDIYPYDEIVMRDGKSFKPPKYYDKQLEIENPEALQTIKQRRIEAVEKKPIQSFTRLKEKENYKKLQLQQLMRGYENGE